MGACMTKDSMGTKSRKNSGSGPVYPSIQDMYRKNKAESMRKNPKRGQTSAFALTPVD